MTNFGFRTDQRRLQGMGKWLGFAALLLLGTTQAFAGAAGTLPWERPLSLIATSLTGPAAYFIGLVGIAISGGTLLWGGELSEWGRRAVMLTLVISILVFAAPLMSSLFGVAGAVV